MKKIKCFILGEILLSSLLMAGCEPMEDVTFGPYIIELPTEAGENYAEVSLDYYESIHDCYDVFIKYTTKNYGDTEAEVKLYLITERVGYEKTEVLDLVISGNSEISGSLYAGTNDLLLNILGGYPCDPGKRILSIAFENLSPNKVILVFSLIVGKRG
jgi:hypothetical protein